MLAATCSDEQLLWSSGRWYWTHLSMTANKLYTDWVALAASCHMIKLWQSRLLSGNFIYFITLLLTVCTSNVYDGTVGTYTVCATTTCFGCSWVFGCQSTANSLSVADLCQTRCKPPVYRSLVTCQLTRHLYLMTLADSLGGCVHKWVGFLFVWREQTKIIILYRNSCQL